MDYNFKLRSNSSLFLGDDLSPLEDEAMKPCSWETIGLKRRKSWL